MKEAKDYYSHHAVQFERCERYGFHSIKVLPELTGKQWDNVALSLVQGLRPSYIRVTEGACTLDARVWRVTVFINEDNSIRKIEQEIEVGLCDERLQNGYHLSHALHWGIDSPQAKWHEIEHEYTSCMFGRMYLVTKDGQNISFPYTEEEEREFDEDMKEMLDRINKSTPSQDE